MKKSHLIFIILISLVLFSILSGRVNAPIDDGAIEPSCSDTDGGNVPLTAGSCNDGYSYPDSCTSTINLKEYYCTGSYGSCTYTTYNCTAYCINAGKKSGSCSNGACVCVTCNSDSECNDNNPCTTDKCNNPGLTTSSCSHSNVADSTSCGTNKYCCSGVCIAFPGTYNSACGSCGYLACSGATYKCYDKTANGGSCLSNSACCSNNCCYNIYGGSCCASGTSCCIKETCTGYDPETGDCRSYSYTYSCCLSTQVCSPNGDCVTPSCTSNSQCTSPPNSCYNTQGTCVNPGQASAYCSYSKKTDGSSCGTNQYCCSGVCVSGTYGAACGNCGTQGCSGSYYACLNDKAVVGGYCVANSQCCSNNCCYNSYGGKCCASGTSCCIKDFYDIEGDYSYSTYSCCLSTQVCSPNGDCYECAPGTNIITHSLYPSGDYSSTATTKWSRSACSSNKICKEYTCKLADADITSYSLPSGKIARSDAVSIPYTIKNVGEAAWTFIVESHMVKAGGSGVWPGSWDTVGSGSSKSGSLTYQMQCSDPLGTWTGDIYSYTDLTAYGGWLVWGTPSYSFQAVQCLNDADCQACLGSGYRCNVGSNACEMIIAQYNASFVSQVLPPSKMGPGQTAAVSVTMKNNGTNTWTKAGSYKLGSQNPQDNTNWGLGRVDLSDTDAIATDQQKTFSFTITAPTTQGLYNFQWRMIRELVTWFGDYSSNFVVNVTTECYEIRLFTNSKPSDTGQTLHKACSCTSVTCECNFTYVPTTTTYGKAESWSGTTFLSSSGWKLIYTEPTEPPYFSDFSYSGHLNYFNVFWNVSYVSTSRVNVSCIFNCDPRIQNCAAAQKCSPYPVVQYPGSGGCTVLNPVYNYTRKTKIVCKVTDVQNADTVRWYPTNPE